MGPACVLPALQQVLAEADHADAPDRQQRQAVKPPGHRPLGPEILETMAADAQGQHQRAGSGQHVPEIGAIAQAGEEEQVVQQQGEDQPVGHAEQQVALAAVFQQFVVAPEPQRKGVAAGIVAAQVDAQRPIAGRYPEQRMTVGVVAALGEGHRFAAAMFTEPAALVGEIQAQVVQAGAGDFQPPAAGYRLASRQVEAQPPGAAAEADAGAAGGGDEAAGLLRLFEVLHRQVAIGVFEQVQRAVQPGAAGRRRRKLRRGARNGAGQ